jgi:hypothetical protein
LILIKHFFIQQIQAIIFHIHLYIISKTKNNNLSLFIRMLLHIN